MGRVLFAVFLIIMMSGMACAEMYAWTDSNGVVNYTSDSRNLPEAMRPGLLSAQPPQAKRAAQEAEKTAAENSTQLLEETTEKIALLQRQIDDGLRSVDEYYEKNRSVSKSDMSSLLNSLSYEIYTLKQLASESFLRNDVKSQVKRHVAELDTKYNEYNKVINDFDSIVIGTITVDGRVSVRTATVTNNRYDTTGQNIYVTEPDLTLTFLVPVTNNGSKADVTIEVSGLNGRGNPVATHTMRTTVSSGSTRDAVDHMVLQGVLAAEIARWEVSDVKIARSRR